MAAFTSWIGDQFLIINGKVTSVEDWTNGKVISIENTLGEFTQIKIPKYVESYKRTQTVVTRNTKALICRVLFALHGLVATWRVVDVDSNPALYALCVPIFLIPFEIPFTVRFTKKGEWKWFCPSVFLYLAGVIPAIWLLHLDLYQKREKFANDHDLDACEIVLPASNATGLPEIKGIPIPLDKLEFQDEEWVSTLQQVMFVILVVGRWLLPKGHLSRDQLSQLLMFYLGIAADSLEFSIETLSLEAVNCDLKLIYAVLAIWTWSMTQFTLVRSSVAGGKPVKSTEQEKTTRSINGVVKTCCESEIWTLLMTVLLQDGPFLTMRLVLMIHFQVFNNLMLFFVIKNILVVCIQLYRVLILIFPGSAHYGERHNRSKAFVKIEHVEESAQADSCIDIGQSAEERGSQGSHENITFGSV